MAVNQYTLFRVYDRMMHDWATEIAVWKGRQVPVVIAAPDRAFSEVAVLLRREGAISPEVNPRVVPLPFISISRGDPAPRTHEWQYRRIPIGHTDSSKREYETAWWPQPQNIPYSLEIWSKYFQTDAGLTEMFMRQFHSYYAYAMAKHMLPYSWKLTPIKFDSFNNNSELEGGDSDRIIRHTLNVTVEGLLFFFPERNFTALNLNIEKYLDEELIDTVKVSATPPDTVETTFEYQ